MVIYLLMGLLLLGQMLMAPGGLVDRACWWFAPLALLLLGACPRRIAGRGCGSAPFFGTVFVASPSRCWCSSGARRSSKRLPSIAAAGSAQIQLNAGASGDGRCCCGVAVLQLARKVPRLMPRLPGRRAGACRRSVGVRQMASPARHSPGQERENKGNASGTDRIGAGTPVAASSAGLLTRGLGGGWPCSGCSSWVSVNRSRLIAGSPQPFAAVFPQPFLPARQAHHLARSAALHPGPNAGHDRCRRRSASVRSSSPDTIWGVPYVFGGSDPRHRFGLLRPGGSWSFRQARVSRCPAPPQQQLRGNPRRVARDPASTGRTWCSLRRTYADPHDWITHVGIYIGGGLGRSNAPTEGQVVSVQPVFKRLSLGRSL